MAKKYFLLLITSLLFSVGSAQVKQLSIGDAIINYTDSGTGIPVVFIHGSLGDYRGWEVQRNLFSDEFRVITYSRRYNYPNQNATSSAIYSPESEADDLALLIKGLNIDKAHVVGHSYGGLVALNFANKYPGLTRSVIVSEPPIVNWLPNIEGGQAEMERLYNTLLRPVQIAFDLRDTADVLRHTTTYFMGSDISAQMPEEARSTIIANFGEWKALVNSSNGFSNLTREDVSTFRMPVMIITTGNTLPMLKLSNAELVRRIPGANHFHLPEASHDLWNTHSDVTSGAVLLFIRDK
jgi:pimeloyl-ACP methyl ester carboxylesterase